MNETYESEELNVFYIHVFEDSLGSSDMLDLITVAIRWKNMNPRTKHVTLSMMDIKVQHSCVHLVKLVWKWLKLSCLLQNTAGGKGGACL